MSKTFALPTATPAVSYWFAGAPVAPPSGAVVAAVVQFGDLWEPREDGTYLVRLSQGRAEAEDIRLVLGDERRRALDISVVWDEAECEIVQVLDVAHLRAPVQSTGNRYADARMRGFPRQGGALDVAA